MSTTLIPDIQITSSNWVDLTLAHPELAGQQIELQCKYPGGRIELVWGGAAAPSQRRAGQLLRDCDVSTGQASHIWARVALAASANSAGRLGCRFVPAVSSGGGSGISETIWTDDTGAFFIRLDSGTAISWTHVDGTASSAPGAGARPAGGTSLIVDSTRYQASAARAGAYAIGDYLSHIVTADPATGVTVADFWLNVTASPPAKLAASPSAADINLIAPLPNGASTAAKQDTGNASLAAIAANQKQAIFYTGTTAALAASATYTGTARDAGVAPGAAHGLAYFSAYFYADQAGVASIEVSADGNTWYQATSATLVAATPLYLQVPVLWRYHRTKLTNGATAQTAVAVNSGYTVA